MSGLHIVGLTAAYPNRRVLEDINLEAKAGQIVALVGPNGAGKSSLLRALCGTLKPSAGELYLNTQNLRRLSIAARARLVAHVPQQAQIPHGFSVAEVVLMGRAPHLHWMRGETARDHMVARRAMQQTDTWHLAERDAHTLSGGEQQRVLIARAIAQEPQLLLLDEPTAHLDLKHQIAALDLLDELARTGLTIIVAIHDLNLAAMYSDTVALLDSGHLVAYDTPTRVLTPAIVQQIYGVRALVSAHPLHGTPLITIKKGLRT